MKNLLLLIIICITVSLGAKSQRLISYELIQSYTKEEVDTLIADAGASLFVTAQNGIEFYKVLYWTPYKHVDSLVRVSGAVAVPVNSECVPLGAYFHGTTSKRTNVPSYESGEAFIGMLMAAEGIMLAMPDYLGLGDSDSSVIVHPYVHAFSQGHTSVNMLRAARELAATLGVDLNGQILLTGYSHGGFTTMATHKLIEEEFSNEFNITASAPMSGPFDLKEAQVDLIASDSVYPTPGYLPFILLGYHAVFDDIAQLYPDIATVFKSPYDSIIPPLFYEKETSIGTINGISTPVPKHMIKDSFVNEFMTDSLHPFRMALAESHLLDWAPRAPVKLIYCRGDDQVTSLNSERAYDSWTARGAQQVEKQDYGDLSHAECVTPAVLAAKNFLESFRDDCATGITESSLDERLFIYPNPANGIVSISLLGDKTNGRVSLFDLTGKLIIRFNKTISVETIDVSDIADGMYVIELNTGQKVYRSKFVVE